MKVFILIANFIKILGFLLFLINEILMLIQGLEYRFHYIVILKIFVPFLLITGVLELIGLEKLELSQFSFYWILPVLFLFVSIQGDNVETSYFVIFANLLGVFISGMVLYQLKIINRKV
jgi:hypothetical protein